MPSAPSCEHVEAVVAGGDGRLDEEVGPRGIVGVAGSGSPSAIHAAASVR